MTHTKTKKIANAAMDYALTYIQKGCTQITNNHLNDVYIKSLEQGILDVRATARQLTRKVTLIPAIRFTLDIHTINFLASVETSKKYSLGNCYELALMALYFIITQSMEMNAEIFNIKGGDHVFLVIGRKDGSSAKNPLTWGKDAYICDPWAGKTYPASDYLLKLKNFKKENHKNSTEDFIPQKHILKPIKKMNIHNFKSSIHQYEKNLECTLKLAIHSLKHDLLNVLEALDIQHNQNKQKRIIIKKMVDKIDFFGKQKLLFQYDFSASVMENRDKNIHLIKHIKKNIQISKRNHTILGQHGFFYSSPTINSILQWFAELIHFFPESKYKIDLSLDKFHNTLNKMIQDNLTTSPQHNFSR